MIRLIKKVFCKHHWAKINIITSELFGNYSDSYIYGCKKCGKTEKMKSYESPEWRFKQIHKGRKVE